MNAEIDQLVLDIRRIGPTHPPPSPKCLFGELFDDEEVEQYYEALVGTLKCAKKRGIIRFKGQMLLKGVHDKVVITVVEEGVPIEDEPEEERPVRMVTPKSTPKSFSYKKAQILKKQKSPIKARQSPIKEKKKSEIGGTFSDSEAGAAAALQKSKNNLNLNIIVASDSEADTVLKSPRRVMIPSIFRSASARSGLPPAAPSSWRLRSSMMMKAATRKPLLLKRWSEQPKPEKKPTPQAKPPKLKLPMARTLSEPVIAQASSTPRNHSGEAASRMEEEVLQLLVDIRRVGSNPGEPNVKFGELFDDDEVQNTYEALVGTLRSAKRQGLISFKGQMLLKGMHDQVVIYVVESS
jgi:hypothetical protein